MPDEDGPVDRNEARKRFHDALQLEKHKPKTGPNGEPDPRDKHTRDDPLDSPQHQEPPE